jgi:hypothetical protein
MHTREEEEKEEDEEDIRVRVEIMGSQKCRIVGKSQSVLMMTNPFSSPAPVHRHRSTGGCTCRI